MDNAMQGFSDMQKRYPYNDGVEGTAAVSSREYYFNHLRNNYNPSQIRQNREAGPQYPENMKKIKQIGTTTPAIGLPSPKPPKRQALPRANLIRGADGELRVGAQ
jgi:hypothetical protein